MNSRGARDPLVVRRDCPAVLVPSGERVMLEAGDVVDVFQYQGGSVTVQTESGYLARVAGDHFDALGLDAEPEPTPTGTPNAEFSLDQVVERLRGVFDPEIPINVVDLGLIYHLDAQPLPSGGHRVEIAMSMTAPGCGMGEVLREDARMRVEALPGVAEVTVDLVWDPPWSIHRMTEAARLELGLL